MSESLGMEVYFKKDYLLHTGRSVNFFTIYHLVKCTLLYINILDVMILIYKECMGNVPHAACIKRKLKIIVVWLF